jgi:head-tail adaptor
VIGGLDQRASLQAKVLTPDGGGGYAEGWQTFASVWVSVSPIGASDAFGPDALESRVLVGARSFKVHALLDEGPRVETVTLLCEELP